MFGFIKTQVEWRSGWMRHESKLRLWNLLQFVDIALKYMHSFYAKCEISMRSSRGTHSDLIFAPSFIQCTSTTDFFLNLHRTFAPPPPGAFAARFMNNSNYYLCECITEGISMTANGIKPIKSGCLPIEIGFAFI